MTNAAIFAKMDARMNETTTDTLKEMAEMLAKRVSALGSNDTAAEHVLDRVIKALESKMPTAEFVGFCDQLI
jgi:hypothetical protein